VQLRYLTGCLWLFTSLCFAGSQDELQYSAACASGKKLRIAAVGDILLHAPLQKNAADQGFTSMWQAALPFVASGDIAYANLEGPIAKGINKSGQEVTDPGNQFDNHVYSSFPLFNYPPGLPPALKQSGFDIVSTANNHSLDRYEVGINKTIDALNQAGLKFVGTRKKEGSESWVRLINKNGFRIAWIACTENTNGIEDKNQQVLYCFKKKDHQTILQTIKNLSDKVDVIVLSPHWGEQYQHQYSRRQQHFAHQALEAGATTIIGSHPHVLQAMEKYITKDNRETFILYSLGNFVSYQGTPKNRSTVVLLLDLVKGENGTQIKAVHFVPMYMQNRQGQQRIRLSKVSKNSQSVARDIISKVLPMKNAVYSLDEAKSENCKTEPRLQVPQF